MELKIYPMKKFLFATLVLLAVSAAGAHAQTFMDRVHFEAAMAAGAKHNGITPVDFSFRALVDFVPASYLFIAVEDNISLYDVEGVKSYSTGVGIGGGVGVRLLGSKSENHSFDVRARAVGSVGNPYWQRNSYDLSLAWYVRTARFSPVVELGYRFIDSRTTGIDDYCNLFLSIGFRY